MGKLVGHVSENEKNDMIDICEVKVALDNLEKIVGKDETDLLEQITRERDIANEKYNAWWDRIRENYDFEGDEQGHWQLDFQTGEVFLVV